MTADASPAPRPDLVAPGRRWWIEGSLIVLFWGLLYLLDVGQKVIDPRGPDGVSTAELLIPGVEYTVWLLLTPCIFWLSSRFSFERERWLLSVAIHIGAALVVASIINLCAHYAYHTFLFTGDRPFQPAQSLLSLRFLDELIIYLVVLGAGFARDYFLRYRQRLEETSRLRAQTAHLQAQLAEARLQALRMQLNPHFLFNTLHAVSSLAGRDPGGVRRMIARLSELLRYALDNTSAQEVPLKEELHFLSGYLEIQRIRFQGRLETTIDVPPALLDAMVPSLILQPLVENAIKHGASRAEDVGRVRVQAWHANDALLLRVCDNGPGLNGQAAAHDTSGNGVGLRNTRERLKSLYGEMQHLALRSSDDDGDFCAEIAVPFHTASDLQATVLPAHEPLA